MKSINLKKQKGNDILLDVRIGKHLKLILLLLASVFFSFIALTFILLFGLSDLFNIYVLFMFVFSVLGVLFVKEGFRFVVRKIVNKDLLEKYKVNKIKNYVFYSVIPFSLGGVLSIIMLFVYKHLIDIGLAVRLSHSTNRQIESIHFSVVLITSILAFISAFAIMVVLLRRNTYSLKHAIGVSFYNVFWLVVMTAAVTLIIFFFSLVVFTVYNVSGGVGFGP